MNQSYPPIENQTLGAARRLLFYNKLMKLLAYYEDPFWENTDIESMRFTTRVILENANGQLGFLKIEGEDALGQRNHYETCGGGVEGDESFFETAAREVQEELGCKAQDFSLIGVIIDRLNPLARLTMSVYVHAFVAHEGLELQRTEAEAELIRDVVWLIPAEAVRALSTAHSPIDAYVHRRDLRALLAWLETREAQP
jgi:8-oxo-dGTP diphosphatase